MHHSAYVNAEKFYHKYCEKNIENKKILDVGSYDVNGTMKPIFEKGQYIGLDMEEGPNVDIVGVSHDIPISDNKIFVIFFYIQQVSIHNINFIFLESFNDIK